MATALAKTPPAVPAAISARCFRAFVQKKDGGSV